MQVSGFIELVEKLRDLRQRSSASNRKREGLVQALLVFKVKVTSFTLDYDLALLILVYLLFSFR